MTCIIPMLTVKNFEPQTKIVIFAVANNLLR